MPYVITKTERCPGIATCPDLTSDHQSRRAVATLEEAKRFCFIALDEFVDDDGTGRTDAWCVADSAACALPESGGTVGPLPDGTMIEVESATDQHLVDELPGEVRRVLWQRYPAAIPRAEIVLSWNAYNARS